MPSPADAHFRRLIVASEPGRLERERHARVIRTLRAMQAWDTNITDLLAYERKLHEAHVREIRHSARVRAELELGRYTRAKAKTEDARKLDPYTLIRQQHRERVAVYRERMLTGRMTPDECSSMEKQSLEYCRTIIRRDKSIKAATNTHLPPFPTLSRLRRMLSGTPKRTDTRLT